MPVLLMPCFISTDAISEMGCLSPDNLCFIWVGSVGIRRVMAASKLLRMPFTPSSIRMWESAATTPGSLHLIASIKYLTLVRSWGSWYVTCSEHFWRVIYANLCCSMNRSREWFVFSFQILVLRKSSELLIFYSHLSSPQCWAIMDLQAPRPFRRRLKDCIVAAMIVPQVASSKWLKHVALSSTNTGCSYDSPSIISRSMLPCYSE